MENRLPRLADLLRKRNALDAEIASLVGRPAEKGHVGEFIASEIFGIELFSSATHKGSDGVFREGRLAGKSVNIKWYPKKEGFVDINERALPDYFLVLTGPKASPAPSRHGTRPWLIESVFLFESRPLVQAIRRSGAKIGVATSVRSEQWLDAEIYPQNRNKSVELTDGQRMMLGKFRSNPSERALPIR